MSRIVHRDLTTAGKRQIENHEDAIEHFRTNLPKDFEGYLPPKGYRHYRYVDKPAPRLGKTVSFKGEFVTAIAKDKLRIDFYRTSIINVLFVSKGKDPDTKCNPRFFWENWEEKGKTQRKQHKDKADEKETVQRQD